MNVRDQSEDTFTGAEDIGLAYAGRGGEDDVEIWVEVGPLCSCPYFPLCDHRN